MRHVWTIICGGSSIDEVSRTLSLFDIFYDPTITLYGEGDPDASFTFPLPHHIVSLWKLEPHEKSYYGSMKASLVSPRGDILYEKELGLDLTHSSNFRSRIFVNGFPIRGVGAYNFHIYMKSAEEDVWTEVDKIPFVVNIETPQNQEKVE